MYWTTEIHGALEQHVSSLQDLEWTHC